MDGTNKVATQMYTSSTRGECPEDKTILTPKLGESLSNFQLKYQLTNGLRQGQEEENGGASTKEAELQWPTENSSRHRRERLTG